MVLRMTDIRRSLVAKLAVPVAALLVVGCDLIPQDGFGKVATRSRDPIPQAAAPAPPLYVAGIVGGAAAVPQLAPGAPPGVTQEMVEAGAQHYATVCGACHGPAGSGTAAAPALNDAQWLHITGTYDEIVAIILSGVTVPLQYAAAMPPRGGGPYTDEQIREISAYVFALSQQAGT
jgi:mono/diheme cytochrome c family protein